MRLELPLLILVFLSYVASDAYQSNYFNGEQYPYHYNNPYYRAGHPEDLRQIMFSLSLPSRQTVTVTTTVRPTLVFPSFPSLSLPFLARPPQRQTTISRLWTSTSTITCTKSTSVPCSVVVESTLKPSSAVMIKLNSTIEDQETTTDVTVTEENEEQFITITPSIVQKVEPTQMSNRGDRAADPQLMVISQPQSTFRSGSFNYRPVVVPFYGTHGEPVAGQRLFFTQIPSTLMVTKTATAFAIATFTLTPTCSTAGTILQCPNA